MIATELRYGIPDIDLAWSRGGSVNPSCFAGHQLVVLFLPKDPQGQHAEIESYRKITEKLLGTDAWFLVVGDKSHVEDNAKTPVALDSDGAAWRSFTEIAGAEKLDRSTGAAFFFTRGGAFHQVWPGSGNADAVAQELLSRS